MYCQFECSGSSSRCWTELLQSFLPNFFRELQRKQATHCTPKTSMFSSPTSLPTHRRLSARVRVWSRRPSRAKWPTRRPTAASVRARSSWRNAMCTVEHTTSLSSLTCAWRHERLFIENFKDHDCIVSSCFRPSEQRVIHTDGGRLIAMATNDKKIRLIDSETCHFVKPVISGHAGSIRCVAISEDQGYVVSGSFDTSIR